MNAQESRVFTAIIIAALFMGGIVAYFIVSMIRQHKRVMRLQRERATAEITALERDRARIATDLHDDLSPMLSAVKLRINSFELADKEDIGQLEKANSSIDDILQRMRQISFDLMPTALLKKGLVVAITQFINDIRQSTSLQIDFNSDPELKLDEQKTVNIYRIVKEIIHNVIKHARATCLVLELKQEKNKLILSATDNGIGFETDNSIKESAGFGLRSIINRTELMDGETYLTAQKGKGTNYTIEIPL